FLQIHLNIDRENEELFLTSYTNIGKWTGEMDMQAKTLKVGMIGAGGIGRVHMETFAKTEGAEIVAVTDVNRVAAEKAAKEYGIAHVQHSAEKLIEDPDLDALLSGVTHKMHAMLAVKGLRANKNSLLKQP